MPIAIVHQVPTASLCVYAAQDVRASGEARLWAACLYRPSVTVPAQNVLGRVSQQRLAAVDSSHIPAARASKMHRPKGLKRSL